MIMKWIKAKRVAPYKHEFSHEFINVKKVKWRDVDTGDAVFIPGDIKDGKTTAVYGRHLVVDPANNVLQNRKGRNFYERSNYLFMEV